MTDLARVRTFWEGHVNNEYYTSAERGSAAYFAEIETRRYRHHYHLVELFDRLRTEPLEDKALLEIGCGIGIDTLTLARLGLGEVVGIDLTDTSIRIASQRARHAGMHNVCFQVGNGEALPFPGNRFDIVYSFGVIHHTPSIASVIAEIHRVLKPGGRALVMIYHRRSFVELVHRAFRLPYESPRDLRDHCPVVNRYTRREAQQLFAAFTRVQVRAEYPFTYGMRHAAAVIPTRIKRPLGRLIGWHLMIEAWKGPEPSTGVNEPVRREGRGEGYR